MTRRPSNISRRRSSFDKRNEINRVAVFTDRQGQWWCSAKTACEVVAASIGARRSEKGAVSSSLWHIGMVTGGKRGQMLCLPADGDLIVVTGNSAVHLAKLVAIGEGANSLDGARVHQLVDATTTIDNRYTASNAGQEAPKWDKQALNKCWQKAYQILRHKNSYK
jgi:hypothetical protein